MRSKLKRARIRLNEIPEGLVLGILLGVSSWSLGSSLYDIYSPSQFEKTDYSFSHQKQVHLVEADLLKQLKLWKHKVPPGFDFKVFTQSLLEAQIKYGIEYEILFAVAVIESGFKIQALSHKGAEGIFQFMPQTAELVWPRMLKTLAPKDPLRSLTPNEAVRDIRASTLMGAFYLKELKNIFSGQLHLALASYNVGPGALKKGLDEGKLLSSEYMFRVYDLANELKKRI